MKDWGTLLAIKYFETVFKRQQLLKRQHFLKNSLKEIHPQRIQLSRDKELENFLQGGLLSFYQAHYLDN